MEIGLRKNGSNPRVGELRGSTDDEQIEMFPTPWPGASPRELTRAFKKFSVGALPPAGLHGDGLYEACTDESIDEQARRFHHGT